MTRLTQSEAQSILEDLEIAGGTDFFVLQMWQRDELLRVADARRYRKPKSANGSRSRSFYAYVDKVAHSCRPWRGFRGSTK